MPTGQLFLTAEQETTPGAIAAPAPVHLARIQTMAVGGPPVLAHQQLDYPIVAAAAITPLVQPIVVSAATGFRRQPHRPRIIAPPIQLQGRMAQSVTSGYTTVGGTTVTQTQSHLIPITPSVTGTVDSLTVYVSGGTAGGSGFVAIYDATGSGGDPGNRLAWGTVTVAANASATWITVPLSSTVTVNNGTGYWLGVGGTGTTTVTFYYDATGATCGRSNISPFNTLDSTLPDPYGTPGWHDSATVSIYATILPVPSSATPGRSNVQTLAAFVLSARRHTDSSVIQNRWSGYQWVGLPPINPLPKQVVIDDAVWTAAAQKNRARRPHIYQQRSAAEETFATPTKSIVVAQAEQTAIRRAHHGSVVQSRWPGYQWVGLPPVTPTPRQIVQDEAAIWQARQDHRRGLVIEPGVQAAAATAGAAPVVPPLPKQVVQDQSAFWPRRPQHGGRIIEPGVQLAAASAPAAPVVTPLPRQIVILARATPRQPRGGHVIQPRMIQAPVTPPPSATVVRCSVVSRRLRGGHVIIGRPLASPVTPPRPQRAVQLAQRRRPRLARPVVGDRQRFATGLGPPPSTLITTPATGIVMVGDRGYVGTGDTGQPSAGDTGTVKTGNTGFPQI